jgi:hypothetical protein
MLNPYCCSVYTFVDGPLESPLAHARQPVLVRISSLFSTLSELACAGLSVEAADGIDSVVSLADTLCSGVNLWNSMVKVVHTHDRHTHGHRLCVLYNIIYVFIYIMLFGYFFSTSL